MAIKQHCDICDQVIPMAESYRTIHFGRGHNPNINIGYDPLVICKHCWKKMLSSVNAEGVYKDVDAVFDEVKNRTKLTIPPEALDTLLGKISEQTSSSVVMGEDDTYRGCKNCKYGNHSINDEPCKSCLNQSNWEEKV